MKPVAIGITEIDFMRDEKGAVHGVTHYGKEDLKALPEHRH